MKTSIRTDTKLWVFEETDQPTTVGAGPAAKGERVYVFGYTWFEARTGALAALQRSSGLVHGREIENVKEHIVEEGSTIAFVDRGSTWFEIVETCRQMSGEEARRLLAFPSPFPAESGSEKTRGEEGILPLGHVGHAAEPAVQPAVEPEPASPRVYLSSEALRALLNANADYNGDWPEIAHIASQAIEALEAMTASRVTVLYDGERREDLLKAEKEVAYEERNRLVALFASMALAMGWRAGIGTHEDKPGEKWDADWRTLVMVETPEGQATWHFHDSQKHLVAHLPPNATKWDGHDTSTKYVRLEQLMHRTMTVETVSAIEAQLATIKACAEARLDEQRIAVIESQDMTRNHTTEELACVHSELNYSRDHENTVSEERYDHDLDVANAVKDVRGRELVRLRSDLAERDAEILEMRRQVNAAKSDALGWAAKYGDQIVECSDEYERGKEEADELHLRMLELRDTEAYKRGLRAAAEECRAFSSKMIECGKAKAFADAIVGTAQWDQKERYEAGRDAAYQCETRIEALIRIEALAKKAST